MITYVFKKSGLGAEKQEVMIGASNTNQVVILAGLSEGEEIFLNKVEGTESESVKLIPEMDGKRNVEEEKVEESEEQAEDDNNQHNGKGKKGKSPSA